MAEGRAPNGSIPLHSRETRTDETGRYVLDGVAKEANRRFLAVADDETGSEGGGHAGVAGVTDAGGRVVSPPLPAVRLVARAMHSERGRGEAAVEIRAGATAEVEIVLRPE